MNKKGRLFIISAPSGTGKTSLVKALLGTQSDTVASISHTTRAPRPGEVDGEDYFFISEEIFTNMVAKDEFLEHAKVFDHFYGTSRMAVQQQLEQGLKVILEIDWQGAAQAHTRMPDALSVFILPPSMHELEMRLRNRAQDSDATIARRMQAASSEIGHYDEFDHVILNADFDHALSELATLFVNSGTYQSTGKNKLRALATQLLSKN